MASAHWQFVRFELFYSSRLLAQTSCELDIDFKSTSSQYMADFKII